MEVKSKSREETTMTMGDDNNIVVEVRRNLNKDTTQLYTAAITGSVSTLHTLLQNDPLLLNEASLTSFSETPLHIASSLGHLSFTQALLANKPQLALVADSLGRTPLHLAAAEGHVDVVRSLLDAGSDACDVRDDQDRIPLHLALMRGRVGVVRELVRVRPESTRVGLDGGSVLHLCVVYGQLESLKVLIELLGEEGDELLRSKDTEDNTVLHVAVMLKQLKIVRYLVSIPKIKENANALNSCGHTALDVLHKSPQDSKSFQIQSLLLETGVSKAKDKTNNVPPPSTTTTLPSAWIKNCLNYLTKHINWIGEAHGNLMVVATVIAAMSFQAAISPPGGVFQEDKLCPTNRTDTTTKCKAGTAVFAYGDTKDRYKGLFHRNTTAFLGSLCVILLHFGGFPLKNKVGTWLVTMVMCVTLSFILSTFLASYLLVSPDEESFDQWSFMISYVWIFMLFIMVLIHSIRFAHWLVYDKISSCVSPNSVFRRRRCFRIVIWCVLFIAPGLAIYELIDFAGLGYSGELMYPD